jgi:SPP1 gp7 family putative phage head morphogenesis protein
MAKTPYRPRNGSYTQIINQATRRVGTLPDVFYEKIPLDLRSVAFTLSGIDRMTTIETVLEDLNKAFENNLTFDQWQEQFNVDLIAELSDARRETVYRTFMTTEYNRGRIELGFDETNDLNWLKYQAIIDDRTRPNHEANDGITRPVDDEFWETNLPPLGFNCRCFVLNVGPGDKELTPKSKLDAEKIEPDTGWSYNKVNPVKSLTSYYRAKSDIFTKTIKDASTNRLLLRNQDQDIWFEKNKKQFTKDE